MAGPQRFHWLKVRATAHATEDPGKVEQALRTFVGEAPIEATLLESHHGGDVRLLEAEVTRQADIRSCLGALGADDAASVLQTLEARADDDGVLYFRLDKQEAYQGRLRLVRSGDALQCRAKIEVHPTGRERALAAWRDWWESSL